MHGALLCKKHELIFNVSMRYVASATMNAPSCSGSQRLGLSNYSLKLGSYKIKACIADYHKVMMHALDWFLPCQSNLYCP